MTHITAVKQQSIMELFTCFRVFISFPVLDISGGSITVGPLLGEKKSEFWKSNHNIMRKSCNYSGESWIFREKDNVWREKLFLYVF